MPWTSRGLLRKQIMNTYKLFIAANLEVVALKNYSHKYVDFKANTAEEAVQIAKTQYGNKFTVSLFSIV